MAALKDGRFWAGVIVGYLICIFIPALNIKGKVSGRAGMG